MAYRLAAAVIEGLLDFRERGVVSGSIKLEGMPEKLELRLKGCPWRDLAGFQLVFRNPNPVHDDKMTGLSDVQEGLVGDMTASRKVKVPDVPIEEIGDYYKTGIPLPFHWGNSLYLEWFSKANGRVVIESADFELTLKPDPTWSMTEAEEEQQLIENREALESYMNQLGDLDLSDRSSEIDPDNPTSQIEADAETETARMDLLIDRINIRMERDNLSPEEFERVMDEERERMRIERGEPKPEPPSPEEEAMQNEWIEAMNAAAEEKLEEFEADDDQVMREHPLVIACRELAIRLRSEGKMEELCAQGVSPEHPMIEIMNGVMIASGKLAGALNSHLEDCDWPPDKLTAGSTLVRLKKARRSLEDAIRGLDAVEEQRLADYDWIRAQRWQIESIHKYVERLISEIRNSL